MITPRVTLTAIAKKANVSIASVSRVIRTPHLTTWKTQNRVHKAIQSLGFEPQYSFKPHSQSALNKKILIIDNQLFPQSLINQGLEQELKAAGYKIFYFRFINFDQNEIHQIITYTINHPLDGIIIINDAPYLKKLFDYAYALPPIVLVNQFSLTFPCVYFDHLTIAYQATEYLLKKKHQRIAILLSDPHKSSTSYLERGYLQALSRANIEMKENYIVHNCFHYIKGVNTIKTLMASATPPTAMICADHLCLNYTDENGTNQQNYQSPYSSILGVLNQCNTMKIAIPDQLSLIYFSHDTQRQHNELDMLSTMHKPLYKMGQKAVHLLFERLQNNESPIHTKILIETELISKSST